MIIKKWQGNYYFHCGFPSTEKANVFCSQTHCIDKCKLNQACIAFKNTEGNPFFNASGTLKTGVFIFLLKEEEVI